MHYGDFPGRRGEPVPVDPPVSELKPLLTVADVILGVTLYHFEKHRRLVVVVVFPILKV